MNLNPPIRQAGEIHTVDPAKLAVCSAEEARELLPQEQANRLNVLPLSVYKTQREEVLYCAVDEEADSETLKAIRFASGLRVKTVAISSESLKAAIFKAYSGSEDRLRKTLGLLESDTEDLQEKFQPLETGEVAKALRGLIEYGVANKVSDIHLNPLRDGTRLKLRIKGELIRRDTALCSLSRHHEIIRRIKVLSGLDTTENNIPQDGSFSMETDPGEVRIRVATIPTEHGEKAVLRILENSVPPDICSLGYTTEEQEYLLQAISKQSGAIIFSGPTGSGKSTTMYALANRLAQQGKNVVSIEDPVELRIDTISQTSIVPERGLDFSKALRSVLRQDPDVILLGEIRDTETAQNSLMAALTGHLILTTVHARSVDKIIPRLEMLGVAADLVKESVNLLVCQRLIPILCSSCAVFDLKESRGLGFPVNKPCGCSECDYSGFTKRIPIAEISDGSEVTISAAGHLKELARMGLISAEQLRAFT